MSRGLAAIGVSIFLHGAVLAALIPGLFAPEETVPPRLVPVMSVEIAAGLPGQERARPHENPRNAGAAPVNARQQSESQSRDAAERRAQEQARASEVTERRRRDAEAAAEAAARARAERAERRRAEQERAEQERVERERAERERAEQERVERERVARERAERARDAQETAAQRAQQTARAEASSAARAGEPTPPRYGVGSGANPLPDYPATARYMGHEGTVLLRVLVRADGRSDRVRIVESSGHDSLDRAARRTVLERWRFEPARRGDEAVPAEVLVPIRFELSAR